MNEISDFCRQYQYHRLKKPSGVEVEIPVHEALAMDEIQVSLCLKSLSD